jgi:hypothetical protein
MYKVTFWRVCLEIVDIATQQWTHFCIFDLHIVVVNKVISFEHFATATQSLCSCTTYSISLPRIWNTGMSYFCADVTKFGVSPTDSTKSPPVQISTTIFFSGRRANVCGQTDIWDRREEPSSSVVLGYGKSGVWIPSDARDFLFHRLSRHALGRTHPTIQWVQNFSPGGKAAGMSR